MERPIIFSGESVQAILDGRKTQTRRVRGLGENRESNEINPIPVKCPYGERGDQLWVRETFCDLGDGTMPGRVIYKASFDDLDAEMMKQSGIGMPIWKSPIYMPRWAVRITLEITAVRVEKLHDINRRDAIREGIPNGAYAINPKTSFSKLWQRVNNKKYPWESNPWVWVIEFKMSEESKTNEEILEKWIRAVRGDVVEKVNFLRETESYAEFYDHVLVMLGLPKGTSPSEQQDKIMLQKISELVDFYKRRHDQ